jgi:hypothetical protein
MADRNSDRTIRDLRRIIAAKKAVLRRKEEESRRLRGRLHQLVERASPMALDHLGVDRVAEVLAWQPSHYSPAMPPIDGLVLEARIQEAQRSIAESVQECAERERVLEQELAALYAEEAADDLEDQRDAALIS